MKPSDTPPRESVYLKIFFYIQSAISLLLTAFSDKFLPEQFLRDSIYFEQRINSNITGYTDSFQVIVNLYTNLGITQASIGLRVFEWLLFFIALLQCRAKPKTSNTEILVFVLSSLYLALLPFYGSLFTKEFLVVIVVNIYFLMKRLAGCKYDIFLLVSMQLVIISSIRKYYVITLIFMIIFLVMRNWLIRYRVFFPVILISFIATVDARTSILTRITGFEIFEIRNITNDGLRIVARSRIQQSNISTSPFENLETFGQVMVQVFFPIQLLSFSVYAFFTFFTVIAINYVLCSQYLIFKTKNLAPEACFLFAFFSTSLIFEPDLGSYVRHGFVYIPFVISLLTKRK